jgi:hypothetical protein
MFENLILYFGLLIVVLFFVMNKLYTTEHGALYVGFMMTAFFFLMHDLYTEAVVVLIFFICYIIAQIFFDWNA